jgi:hypothetical protein
MLLAVCCYDIYRNRGRMRPATEQNATDRADIIVVAAISNRDVLAVRDEIIDRVEVDLTAFRRPGGNPGVSAANLFQLASRP